MSPLVSVRFLQTQTDARLVALSRAGHERAFEALVQRYRKPLLAYCRRLLLPEARAEDALQQALLQAWLALQKETEVRNAKAWLYGIVHNAAISSLRASGYDYGELSESLHGAGAPEEDLDRRIAVRETLAGLAALPAMQREVILRTAVEGTSHEEVARSLGLSDNAVRGLVYRARATLRAAATAVTPIPLLTWASGRGTSGAPLSQRLAELTAGGSAGVGGMLLKGGAIAVTAGALATGTGIVHPDLPAGWPGGRIGACQDRQEVPRHFCRASCGRARTRRHGPRSQLRVCLARGTAVAPGRRPARRRGHGARRLDRAARRRLGRPRIVWARSRRRAGDPSSGNDGHGDGGSGSGSGGGSGDKGSGAGDSRGGSVTSGSSGSSGKGSTDASGSSSGTSSDATPSGDSSASAPSDATGVLAPVTSGPDGSSSVFRGGSTGSGSTAPAVLADDGGGSGH